MAATPDEISEWPHWINISVTILQINTQEKSDLFALTLQNQGLKSLTQSEETNAFPEASLRPHR